MDQEHRATRADELVGLVRAAEGETPAMHPDGSPMRFGDGRAVAAELATVELLVEIRDLLRGEYATPETPLGLFALPTVDGVPDLFGLRAKLEAVAGRYQLGGRAKPLLDELTVAVGDWITGKEG